MCLVKLPKPPKLRGDWIPDASPTASTLGSVVCSGLSRYVGNIPAVNFANISDEAKVIITIIIHSDPSYYDLIECQVNDLKQCNGCIECKVCVTLISAIRS